MALIPICRPTYISFDGAWSEVSTSLHLADEREASEPKYGRQSRPFQGAAAGAYGGVMGGGTRGQVPSRPLWVRVVLAAAAVLVLGACQVDLSVEIDVAAGGGGRVRAVISLDKEAAAQVPDLARQLRLEDLEAAGWVVDGPRPSEGGGVVLEVSKGFASPAGATQVLQELGGEGGPFSSLRVSRQASLWKTKTALRGTVDLSKGLDAFGDARLTEQLGGPGLGLDQAAVERELGRPLAEALTVRVVGRLPGDTASNAPGAGEDVWPLPLGGTINVAASAEQWNTTRLTFTAVAVSSGLALAMVLLRRRRRR